MLFARKAKGAGRKGTGVNALKVRLLFWVFVSLCMVPGLSAQDRTFVVLDPNSFKHYVEDFNRTDEEVTIQHIPNKQAWEFLEKNIPFFECPDKEWERTYYFRWWTYRKHIKHTPDGFVITEFLPDVPWAGKHNTISCPAGHHFYEGRWLNDSRYLEDYAVFWFRKGGEPRRYSFWAADSLYAKYLVGGNKNLITDLFDELIRNYQAWESDHLEADGLFQQIDDRDGMELSIGGSGKRPTINAYMYGDANAISKIAELAGEDAIARAYTEKARKLKSLVQENLWDDKAKFFKTLPCDSDQLVQVRELHGYTPWYFNLPDQGYEDAWKQLMDPFGFYAPYGPTTAEQRHPEFMKRTTKGCQWDGPSWPFATSVTLTALANLLNNYDQDVVDKSDYFETLRIYTLSQRLERRNGEIVPWIDENLQPYTGEWIMRTINRMWNWSRNAYERGKDYNHSTYCDLIISGLVGVRPSDDGTVTVNPLLPDGCWEYFCLDRIPCRGKVLTVLWDRAGKQYGCGPGLHVFLNGNEVAHSKQLERLTITF